MTKLATAALLVWGVASFGAVYPWGYWPLAVGAAAVGLVLAWRRRTHLPIRGTALWLLVLAAILVQLVPVYQPLLGRLSPATDALLSERVLLYRVAQTPHPISVHPAGTLAALGLLAAMGAYAIGLVGELCAGGTRDARRHQKGRVTAEWIIAAVVITGTVIALAALVQSATFNGKLLWVWSPQGRATNAFGPFVNRNHFAGWMVLATSLGAGYLASQLARTSRQRGTTIRESVLWWSSPRGAWIVGTGAGIGVMAIALVWSMSRSGILAYVVSTAVLIGGSIGATHRRRVVAIAFAAVAVLALGRKGTADLTAWYAQTGTLEWRLSLWRDSLPALADFSRFGSGINTYEQMILGYARSDPNHNPVNAHNDYLQLAIEGGLLVVVPVAIAAVAAITTAWRRLRAPQPAHAYWLRLGAWAGLTGIAVQELSDFTLRIPGALILAATAVAIALHEPAPVGDQGAAR